MVNITEAGVNAMGHGDVGRLSNDDVVRLSEQIAELTAAGLPLASGLRATAEELPLLKQYAAHLPMLFIVSEVEVRPASDPTAPRVTIERAAGVKCERCWRIVPAVSAEPATAGLCDRCKGALAGTAVHG